MFVFEVTGETGARAEIRVQALDWSQSGVVSFSCNDDPLAVLLLTECRCDAVGFFNLLAGCKPLYVEQWLTYLQESGRIARMACRQRSPAEADYLADAGLESEELNALLGQIYRVAGFNRLQINRYLKHRHNQTLLATRYDQKELERYRQLNDVILTLLRFKRSQ
ncbi:hypothetical protein [Aeromonas bivalvium]|uniref:hypothetical protein n=1 Tax=Aeromonas bivalvium TaxID=440079 RepID=UPI003D1A1B0F